MKFKPIETMKSSKLHCINRVENYFAYLWQFRSIFSVTTSKDLKGRFKYTFLGYFWHLINPLSQIIIYLLIFTVIFGKGIPNYWVYVSSGMFAYSFFTSCASSGSNTIVSNSRMITKMAMAREILVFSKVTVNLITTLISYGLLTIIMILSGVGASIHMMLLPVILAIYTLFCTGLMLALSSIVVYIRDVANAIGIIVGCMVFAIPIMYMAEQRSTPAMELFWSINPLYYFMEVIHDIVYWKIWPDTTYITICLIVSIITFLIGLFIFKKLERGFAERL